ncbi:MAG: hypothetical protein ACRCUM_04005 [Mycoplasmoidaceae bacterium]
MEKQKELLKKLYIKLDEVENKYDFYCDLNQLVQGIFNEDDDKLEKELELKRLETNYGLKNDVGDIWECGATIYEIVPEYENMSNFFYLCIKLVEEIIKENNILKYEPMDFSNWDQNKALYLTFEDGFKVKLALFKDEDDNSIENEITIQIDNFVEDKTIIEGVMEFNKMKKIYYENLDNNQKRKTGQ